MSLFFYPLLSDSDAASILFFSELNALDHHKGSLLSFHQKGLYLGLCKEVCLNVDSCQMARP